MTDLELPVARPIAREPSHPGELMREILEEQVNISISEAARRMAISRPALYAVLNGTGAVTPEMALRFARLVKGEPDLYLQMQARRDLWLAGQRLKHQLDRIEPAV
jgi:addiction module HigA family antidote